MVLIRKVSGDACSSTPVEPDLDSVVVYLKRGITYVGFPSVEIPLIGQHDDWVESCEGMWCSVCRGASGERAGLDLGD